MRNLNSDRPKEPQLLLITAVPTPDTVGDKFDAMLGDKVLVTGTRTPFCDGARALVELGYDPGTVIAVAHAVDPDVICLKAKIGVAATLTVKERDKGGIFEPWKPFVSSPVRSPSHFERVQAPEHLPALAASLAEAVP